jgi:hypothetical protein
MPKFILLISTFFIIACSRTEEPDNCVLGRNNIEINTNNLEYIESMYNSKDWKSKTKPFFKKDDTISRFSFTNIDDCGLEKDFFSITNFSIENNEKQNDINVSIYINSALKYELVFGSPLDSLDKNFNNYIKINRAINDSIYVGELQFKVHRREIYSRFNQSELNTYTFENGKFSFIWKK